MDYRFTLNLPETKFSMKANLSFRELDILDFWSNFNYFIYKSKSTKIFVLNDGPPYSNGDIHIGHAFNKILKDIISRFKTLDGYNVNFVPGWDCHGLPIELNVEKFIKKSNMVVSDDDFRLLCRNYANDQIKIQKSSFVRLGIKALWDDFYKTMDYSFESSIVTTFSILVKNGYVYSSVRPVYWCFDCCSALADAELEYIDKESDSIYVFFEIFDFRNFFDKFYFSKVGFIVWTTTPWTLPFNEAIALNPKAEYILLGSKDIGYIFDKNLLDVILKKLLFARYYILHIFNADFFINMRVIHPIYNKFIKVVLSDHVTSDSGTGCVHIAPAHGYDDYKVALKNNLPIINKVDVNGYFLGNVEIFANFNIKNVNLEIISTIKNKSNFLLHETIIHRYPHCWRHKTPLIFRTTEQWFLNIDHNDLRDKLINYCYDYISWIPESGRKRMCAMLTDRPDWCISRQRIWGVPIFLFVNKYDNSIHPRTLDILDDIIKMIFKNGTNFWYNDNIFDFFNIDKEIYIKISDVLDVWYDSGSVYKFISNKFNLSLPFDLCLEGSDQYRGWFQSSLINSIACYSIPCFKTILAHGFILDGFGRKMSKSLNNVISPNDVIKIYGADLLRLWVSSVNYCFDVNISDEILARVCESYRKIRNTFRFFLSNISDFFLELKLIDFDKILYLDKWIIKKFSILFLDVINDFNLYKFFTIYKKIYNFCIDDLGMRYFELIKDRLYLNRYDSLPRLSSQMTLYYILYNFTKLISPILSFTSEEVWCNIKYVDVRSVHKSFFDIDINFFNSSNLFLLFDFIFFDKLFILKSEVNKMIEEFRIIHSIGSSLELELDLFLDIYWFNLLKSFFNDLYLFFLVSNVSIFLSLDKLKNGVFLQVKVSTFLKCERCWHRSVGRTTDFKLSICFRCIYNIYYGFENRYLC